MERVILMDMDELLKDCRILIPAGFFIMMMANWFPEYVFEMLKFLGKTGVGISVFLVTWEVGKRGHN
jgi:hypothetical protein